MRRNAATWFDPPKGSWSRGGIVVHVNPELRLEIAGVRHVVKLYFKADGLPRKNIATITRLMEKALAEEGSRWSAAEPGRGVAPSRRPDL